MWCNRIQKYPDTFWCHCIQKSSLFCKNVIVSIKASAYYIYQLLTQIWAYKLSKSLKMLSNASCFIFCSHFLSFMSRWVWYSSSLEVWLALDFKQTPKWFSTSYSFILLHIQVCFFSKLAGQTGNQKAVVVCPDCCFRLGRCGWHELAPL